jgi:3-oxoacyl-[acyl-carrier-protein] synthase-1
MFKSNDTEKGSEIPLVVTGIGMFTSVGVNAAQTCTSIRADLSRFTELSLVDTTGEKIVGAPVAHIRADLVGLAKIMAMAVPAISECLRDSKTNNTARTALLLCTPERERPQVRHDIADILSATLQKQMELSFNDKYSKVFRGGHAALVSALAYARMVLNDRSITNCVIGGADSLLQQRILHGLQEIGRLKTESNPYGFIPGEGACFVSVQRLDATQDASRRRYAYIVGLGAVTADEHRNSAHLAMALSQSIRLGFSDAGLSASRVDFRMCDLNGERRRFLESSISHIRVFDTYKAHLPVFHPLDCVGEIGSAAGPFLLALSSVALWKSFAPGRIGLVELAADDGLFGSVLVRSTIE